MGNINSVRDVSVPSFIGMKYSDVQNNPEYKFVWKVENVYDPNQEEDVIIDQIPPADSKKIKEGTTIILKVNSSGVLVTIPSVRGLTEEAAKSKLNNIGIKHEILMIVDDDTAEGIVKNSDPTEGTRVTANTIVRIYVSKGPSEQKILMPDVIDKSLETAKNEVMSRGLKVSDVFEYENSNKPKDTIITTNPLPGVQVSLDSVVKFTLSSGKKKEKSFEVKIDLPDKIEDEKTNITLTIYIDGVLDSTKTIRPSYNSGIYLFTIKGATGKKRINVDIDGKQYRIYEVDFDADSNNVKTTAEFEYNSDLREGVQRGGNETS
jgi:serine/threonine-protein kinase